MLFTFSLNNICIEKIKKELIREDIKVFNSVLTYIFKGILIIKSR
jgi:hypothetical protein